MKNFKVTILLFCVVICVFLFSGCHSIDIGNDQIQSDVFTEIKKKDFSDVDSITNFIFKEADISESDKEAISLKYENGNNLLKYDCSFTITSIPQNIDVSYSILYIYIENKWDIASFYAINSDQWVYTPKEGKSSSLILEDLTDVKFDKFEIGYIGKNDNTDIKINSRDTDLKAGTDNVSVMLTVSTDFAIYTINARINYVFEQGKWLIEKTDIDPSDKWIIKYNKDNLPTAPSEETVLERLSNSAYFLSYLFNKEYTNKYNIKFKEESSGSASFNFNYLFSVDYGNLGSYDFDVSVGYVWDMEWVENKITITPCDMDIKQMADTVWEDKDGNNIKFTKIDSSVSNPFKNPNMLVGSYYKKGEKEGQSIKFQIQPEQKDNNWGCIVFDSDNKQTEDILTLDFENKTIIFNSVVFSAKA